MAALGNTTSSPPAVALRGITKRFGSVVANDRVDLTLHRGEILSLLGERPKLLREGAIRREEITEVIGPCD